MEKKQSIHQEVCEAVKILHTNKKGQQALMMTNEICQALDGDAIRTIIERYLHEYS